MILHAGSTFVMIYNYVFPMIDAALIFSIIMNINALVIHVRLSLSLSLSLEVVVRERYNYRSSTILSSVIFSGFLSTQNSKTEKL